MTPALLTERPQGQEPAGRGRMGHVTSGDVPRPNLGRGEGGLLEKHMYGH